MGNRKHNRNAMPYGPPKPSNVSLIRWGLGGTGWVVGINLPEQALRPVRTNIFGYSPQPPTPAINLLAALWCCGSSARWLATPRGFRSGLPKAVTRSDYGTPCKVNMLPWALPFQIRQKRTWRPKTGLLEIQTKCWRHSPHGNVRLVFMLVPMSCFLRQRGLFLRLHPPNDRYGPHERRVHHSRGHQEAWDVVGSAWESENGYSF